MTKPAPVPADLFKVLVCFALKEEAKAFLRLNRNKAGVSVLLTGIGKQNAQRTVREFLAKQRVDLVLSCGFAGGLDPDLKAGAVVFATEEKSIAEKLIGAGASPAIFHCASRIATTISEKKELRRVTGADVVEMESAAIAAVCREQNIPSATVRAISDVAHEDLPLDFNQLSNPDLSLNAGKLALAIAKSPGKIPALMRLQKNCQAAAENLAHVLGAVIENGKRSAGS